MSEGDRFSLGESSDTHDSYGFSCRACGAPSRSLVEPCSSCGAAPPRGDERFKLLRHRDRLRRAQQMLRALVSARLLHQQAEQGLLQARQTRLAGGVLLVVWFPASAMLIAEGIISCGTALLGVPLIALVTWAGIRISLHLLTSAMARARRRIAVELDRIDATIVVRCPDCGGSASMLQIQDESMVACPWCGGLLAAEPGSTQPEHDRVKRVVDEQMTLARRAVAAASDRLPSERQRELPSGFDQSTGLYVGLHRGHPAWHGEDAISGAGFCRLEMGGETGWDQVLFCTRSEAETGFREAAATWHSPLPTRLLATYAVDWLIYGEHGTPLDEIDRLLLPLYELEPGDCLIVDRAGVSIWRSGAIPFSDPDLLRDKCDLLATLVEDLGRRWHDGLLRASPATPPTNGTV